MQVKMSNRKSDENIKTEESSSSSSNPDAETEFVPTYNYTHTKDDDMGYYFFPGRRQGEVKLESQTLSAKMGSWKSAFNFGHRQDHVKCRESVYACATKSSKVMLLLRALAAHGCPINLERHVQCEHCRERVSGGFEFSTTQVVLCENVLQTEEQICNSMGHELVHAFDKCRVKLDATNIEHVACSEVRAANLMHCNIGSAYGQGQVQPWNLGARHQACARNKAIRSVRAIRNIDENDAAAVVDKVFSKCYNDLEPFGRRVRLGPNESEQALRDGLLYGYTPLLAENSPSRAKQE